MGTKICTKCREEKALNEYHRDGNGFQSRCKDCRNKEKRDWTLCHPIENSERCKRWYYKNRENNISAARNTERINKAKQRKNNICVRIKDNINARLNKALKRNGIVKSNQLTELIGCTVAELKKHMGSQFKDGMNWDNYGVYGWHIDHIKPCAVFDLKDIEQQKECFHYTNLQPLWAKDNLNKGASYLSG